MSGKTVMKLSEIKPSVTWDANNARNILIKIGASLLKKIEKTDHAKAVGAVKCTDAGNGKIQFEWSGTANKLVVEELIRYH
jgi:hypothetical protein